MASLFQRRESEWMSLQELEAADYADCGDWETTGREGRLGMAQSEQVRRGRETMATQARYKEGIMAQ
jgi:hypothetical protein